MKKIYSSKVRGVALVTLSVFLLSNSFAYPDIPKVIFANSNLTRTKAAALTGSIDLELRHSLGLPVKLSPMPEKTQEARLIDLSDVLSRSELRSIAPASVKAVTEQQIRKYFEQLMWPNAVFQSAEIVSDIMDRETDEITFALRPPESTAKRYRPIRVVVAIIHIQHHGQPETVPMVYILDAAKTGLDGLPVYLGHARVSMSDDLEYTAVSTSVLEPYRREALLQRAITLLIKNEEIAKWSSDNDLSDDAQLMYLRMKERDPRLSVSIQTNSRGPHFEVVARRSELRSHDSTISLKSLGNYFLNAIAIGVLALIFWKLGFMDKVKEVSAVPVAIYLGKTLFTFVFFAVISDTLAKRWFHEKISKKSIFKAIQSGAINGAVTIGFFFLVALIPDPTGVTPALLQTFILVQIREFVTRKIFHIEDKAKKEPDIINRNFEAVWVSRLWAIGKNIIVWSVFPFWMRAPMEAVSTQYFKQYFDWARHDSRPSIIARPNWVESIRTWMPWQSKKLALMVYSCAAGPLLALNIVKSIYSRNTVPVKIVTSVTLISGLAVAQYFIGMPDEKKMPVESLLANLGVFAVFWVVTDFLGQWIAGRGIRIKQVLWSLPIGLVCAWVTARGYAWINYFIPKDAHLNSMQEFELASFSVFLFSRIFVPKQISVKFFIGVSALLGALSLMDVSVRHVAIAGPRVFATFLIVYIRQTLYSWTVKKVLSEPERDQIDQEEAKLSKAKKDESFWLTRMFSLIKNYIIMALPPGVAVAAEGIVTQYFQIFYTWSQNKKGFWFKSEEDRKNIPYLIWFPFIAPFQILFRHKKNDVKAADSDSPSNRSELRVLSQMNSDFLNGVAVAIKTEFERYQNEFSLLTRRAQGIFEAEDWKARLADDQERLEIYKKTIDQAEGRLRELMKDKEGNEDAWRLLKALYAISIKERSDADLAMTFFNSVARRFVSVNISHVMFQPDEIVAVEKSKASVESAYRVYPVYRRDAPLATEVQISTEDILKEVFQDYRFNVKYQNFERDVKKTAEKIDRFLNEIFGFANIHFLEMAKPVFYRNKNAYLMGRLKVGRIMIPIVIRLTHATEGEGDGKRGGLVIHDVLLEEQIAGQIFTFSRTGFHVNTQDHRALVKFLHTLAPRKDLYEFYWEIGYFNHARSKFYEHFQAELKSNPSKLFEKTSGEEGHVMHAFTLPGFDNVFKVIRHRVHPNDRRAGQLADKAQIRKSYEFVRRVDRAGRLLDAISLGDLKLEKKLFSADLLKDLLADASEAGSDIVEDGNYLIFKNVYVQKKLTPLDIFLRTETNPHKIKAVMIDYGNLVRTLAFNNIYYGDYYPKNFGVTSYGRVLGYDPDAIEPVTSSIHFRNIPPPSDDDEMMMPLEDRITFQENDAFPELLLIEDFGRIDRFLVKMFESQHADLLDAKFWRGIQVIHTIRGAYLEYSNEFRRLTYLSKSHFENREWASVVKEASERIITFRSTIDRVIPRVKELLEDGAYDSELWLRIQSYFSEIVVGQYDADLEMTFFYSVMRRILAEKGIPVEYKDDGVADRKAFLREETFLRKYPATGENRLDTMKGILQDVNFSISYENLDRDAERVSEQLSEDLIRLTGIDSFDQIEILKPVFYRNKGAYLVGRIKAGEKVIPFILALTNPNGSIVVDALLVDEADVNSIFSFTRTNFHVETKSYRELVGFLQTIMPRKGLSAIYSSIGFIQPAKIQVIKELREHLAKTHERITSTQGMAGTIMTTFTLPGFPYVFKLINYLSPRRFTSDPEDPDWDPMPKQHIATAEDVRQKYRLVHRHDRVGRMLDTMVMKNVEFPAELFDDEIKERLRAAVRIDVSGPTIRFPELFVQRKVTPLEIALPRASKEEQRRIWLDLGQAIKDLAYAGLFSDDFDQKNAGITEHGRVVSFDYDELRVLSELTFVEQLSQDADWRGRHFHNQVVASNLMNEFGVPEEFQEDFKKAHGEILTVEFWRNVQERIQSGELHDWYPYPQERRLRGNVNARSELRHFLVPEQTLAPKAVGLAFDREDAFENLTLPVLRELALSGIQIAVTTTTRSELRLIEQLNRELPDGHKVLPAKSLAESAALLRAKGIKEARFMTTNRSTIPLASPYFDVVVYLPLAKFMNWVKSFSQKLADQMAQSKAVYLALLEAA